MCKRPSDPTPHQESAREWRAVVEAPRPLVMALLPVSVTILTLATFVLSSTNEIPDHGRFVFAIELSAWAIFPLVVSIAFMYEDRISEVVPRHTQSNFLIRIIARKPRYHLFIESLASYAGILLFCVSAITLASWATLNLSDIGN